MIESGGIQKNSKSKRTSADSNLGPRCEASVISKDLPTLQPRFECSNKARNLPCEGRECRWVEFCDFEPCLKTNFRTYVNALPNFSIKIGGKKPFLGQMV
ncbi:hypothetical protein AVEN_23673-1 [Araneus ventricosus]|uniref:Uncharacterized protein n=1 Tax=Araneus ventricosus TaxID=182803 RepID=A0A4Y2BKD6_ARAVE|nr:hypothetical protein AVEN_23673-1 [Araneus ventricosus]